MNRQYIGARYVPKFFNNDGSNEWVQGIAYEPLTIVTYLNTTYTSTKPVPSNIGSPNLNPTYWVSTANYGAIIENLQNEINTLSNNLDSVSTSVDTLNENYKKRYTLNNRKFIFVGDSYGTALYGNWVAQLGNILGINDYIDCAVDGSAFSSPDVESQWITILQNNTASLTSDEKNSITDIICLGGINDAMPYSAYSSVIENPDDIKVSVWTTDKINAFLTYCKTTFPNAIVSLGFIGNTDHNDYRTYPNVARAMYDWDECCSSHNNVRKINGMQYLMHDYQNMAADWIHPTADAGLLIAKECASFILGGNVNYDRAFKVGNDKLVKGTNTDSRISKWTLGDNDKQNVRINGNLITGFIGSYLSIEFNNLASNITFAEGTDIVIGEMKQKQILYGKGLVKIPIKCLWYDRTGASTVGTEFASAYIYFNEGLLHLEIMSLSPDYRITSISATQLTISLPPIQMDALLN